MLLPTTTFGYNGIIYYVVHKLHFFSRMAIHLGIHNHLIMDGKCTESLEEIRRLIVEEVNHTHDMKMSLIFLSVNKTFLARHLFNDCNDAKVELLKGEQLEQI